MTKKIKKSLLTHMDTKDTLKKVKKVKMATSKPKKKRGSSLKTICIEDFIRGLSKIQKQKNIKTKILKPSKKTAINMSILDGVKFFMDSNQTPVDHHLEIIV